MKIEKEIRKLIDTLNVHTKLYDEGTPILSDKDWDDLYFALQNMEKESGIYFPDSPTQKISFEVVNELHKVKHSHLMLSLDKTKSVDEIKSFIGDKKFICMGKMDGLTCALRYEDGYLISAETRGNGEIGEDVLHNAKVIKNIPKKINRKGIVEVDGELICTYRDFESFSGEFKNPRNFASGSIRLLDSQEVSKRKLTFVAWDWINNPYNTLGEALVELGRLGFITVPFEDGLELKYDDIDTVFKEVKRFCEEESFPIDGLVIKYDDVNEFAAVGRTDHHFKGGMAFKFYDEETWSTVTGIEWSMGRTGCLTPVIEFEPIQINGTEVSRASAHNMSILLGMWEVGKTGCIGDKVAVIKSNEIIPQITVWQHEPTATEKIKYPALCPICGGRTSLHTEDSGVQTVWCDNPDCEGKLLNRIEHYGSMKKGLEIKGLSKATIEKLMDKNWLNSISDLYTLKEHKKEWSNLPGFGEKSVTNILSSIDNSRNCYLWQFISALGIPLIGVTASKALSVEFGSWATFRKSIEENFNISTLPNFGLEMEKSLKNFNYTEADYIAQNFINFIEETNKEQPQTLEGITVCITGKLTEFKNRALFQEAIELAGGKVTSSVSSKTNYLITNDTTSGSSKNVAAAKLGVEIISEKDFISKFLT